MIADAPDHVQERYLALDGWIGSRWRFADRQLSHVYPW
jgi:hypothetical protein